MSDPQEVTLVAIVKPADGKHERFQKLTTEYAKYVQENEPNTLQFQLLKEEADSRYVLVERYKTQGDLDTHRQDPKHIQLFQTFAEELVVTEPPILFVGNAVAGYQSR